MPRLTSIKPQKNGKRLNIYLDGKFGFGIDLENFVKAGLRLEQELSESEVENIIKKAEFQKTLDKLLNFSTLRPRSEKEIDRYFKRKKVHPSIQKELMDKLIHLDLVDDRKFAEWWIAQRIEFKPVGIKLLKLELKAKGIKEDVIEDSLEKTEIDEEKMAKEELNKRLYRWKNLSSQEQRQKMSQYLARKGFAWNIISRLVKGNYDDQI